MLSENLTFYKDHNCPVQSLIQIYKILDGLDYRRIVMLNFLRHTNTLTYLLTYLLVCLRQKSDLDL